MRLLECYIENFGKLHNETICFEKEMTVICEQNGWGKSTLAAFLRAMFYGLEGERKRDITGNERKRYRPWQGGAFGGKLTFEAGGKIYTVTRFFGEKESGDSFELREKTTNLLSEDYTENLGMELFGLNRTSFGNTIFIDHNCMEMTATDEISRRISGNVDFEESSFEKAMDQLNSAINSLAPNKKSGALYQRKERMTGLLQQLREENQAEKKLAEIRNALLVEESRLANYKKEQQALAKEQSSLVKRQVAEGRKSEWNSLKARAQEGKTKREELRRFFGQEIPEAEAVESQLQNLAEAERERIRLEAGALTAEEEQQWRKGKDCFGTSVPGALEIAETDDKLKQVKKLEELKNRLALAGISEQDAERIAKLQEILRTPDSGRGNSYHAYADAEAGKSKAEELLCRWDVRSEQKAFVQGLQRELETVLRQRRDRNRRKMRIVCGLLFGGILLVGAAGAAALFWPKMLWAAGIAAVLGILICGAAWMVSYAEKRQNGGQLSEIAQRNKQIEEELAKIEKTEREMEAFLTGKGMDYHEETASQQLRMLAAVQQELEVLLQRRDESEQRTAAVRTEIESLEAELIPFLGKYHLLETGTDLREMLYLLKDLAQKFAELEQRKIQLEQMERCCLEKESMADAFLEHFGFEKQNDRKEQLTLIRDKIREYDAAAQAADQAERELRQFEEKTAPELFEEQSERRGTNRETVGESDRLRDTADSENEGINEQLWETADPEERYRQTLKLSESLLEKMEECREKIREGQNEMLFLQGKRERWEECRSLLEEEERQEKLERQKYQDLVRTKEILENAKRELTARYTEPVMEAFRGYYEQILPSEGSKYYMDANTKVTVEEQGKQRELAALSTGLGDLVSFCLRMAFADVMFEKERPMLILDDPFANLDDEKLTAAYELLSGIAGRYQILYFTCCDSRTGPGSWE